MRNVQPTFTLIGHVVMSVVDKTFLYPIHVY